MRIVFFLMIFLLASCKDSKPINEPKNLIDKEKMSALIADFAINDQMSMLNSKGNMEVSSRYLLKKHGVTAIQFHQSYEYYLASPRVMQKILDNSQNIIKDQDKDAEKYIDKKLEEIGKGVPAFAR